MRRLVFVVLMVLLAGLPVVAQAQSPAQPAATAVPAVLGSDFGLHPALVIAAGAVSGVILASAVAGSLISGALLLEGAPLAEALEVGTGLSLPAIAASAVAGGLSGYLLSKP